MYQKKHVHICDIMYIYSMYQYISAYVCSFCRGSFATSENTTTTLQIARFGSISRYISLKAFLGGLQILKRQKKIEELSKWVGFGVSCFSKIDSKSNESINWSLTLNSQDEIDEETFTPLRKQHTQGGLMTVWKLSMLPSDKAFN